MGPEADESAALARWRESAVSAAGRAYEAAHGREIDDNAQGMRWDISPRVALTVAGTLALVALLVWALWRPSGDGGLEPVPGAAASPEASPTPSTGTTPEAADPRGVIVHVAGAVAAPGLVELEAGQRIADAIAAAGGANDDADLGAINLARVPVDGEQISVPLEGAAPEGDAGASPPTGGGAVSLNTADAAALEELPGIGPVLAARIIADREANGPFASLEDLQRVSGVGEAMVANLDGLATM